MSATVATGLTLKRAGVALTLEILDASLEGASRESIPTSHQLTTGARTFTPATLPDYGSLRVDYHVDLTDATDGMPDLSDGVEAWLLEHPSNGTKRISFNGYIADFSAPFTFENKAQGSFSVKISGLPVIEAIV